MGATGINQSVQIFNGVKQLDTTLIRRSNDVSAFDMGDSINKEYLRNVALINNLNLTDAEKTDAIERQYQLSSEALQLQSKSINERVVAGPARRVSGNTNYDKVVNKRAEVANHLKSMQDKSKANDKAISRKNMAEAMKTAIANKSLEFTFEGKTWRRKSLRSKSFTSN